MRTNIRNHTNGHRRIKSKFLKRNGNLVRKKTVKAAPPRPRRRATPGSSALAISGRSWKGTLPAPRDATHFLRSKLPARNTVVEGMIHRGAIMSLSGDSKARKSWGLLDMAVSVATGTDFWGRATNKGSVLYCNLELPPQDLQERISKIAKAKGVSLRPGDLTLWNLRGTIYKIEDIVNDAITQLAMADVSIILIDPIYKCYGGRDENSASDMTALFQEIDILAQKLNVAIVFAAHFSKGEASAKTPLDRTSGSGVFARFPDTILTSSKHRDEERYIINITARSFASQRDFVVRWNDPLLIVDQYSDPKLIKRGAGPGVNQAKFIGCLAKKPLTFSEWRDAAADAAGVSPGSFKDHRVKSLAEKTVEQDEETDKYRLTKKGKELIETSSSTASTTGRKKGNRRW